MQKTIPLPLLTSALISSLPGCLTSGANLASTGTGELSDTPASRLALTGPRYAECGSGGLTANGLEQLGRAPYVQRVTATSADVLFTLADAGEAPPVQLTSGDGSALDSVLAEIDPADSSGRQWLARLQGLEPGKTYCYSLDGFTERLGFRTAPLPGSGAPVRFVVFGDSGGGTLQGDVRAQLDAVPFDLMLHTGDIAYGGAGVGQLERQFFDEYSGILEHVPAFPVTGNHDYETDGAAPYRQVFALPENGGAGGLERWFSFDFGDVHFVALDTERVGAEQTDWLDQDLASNELPWTVVYLHRPPYSSGDHGSDRKVRGAFVPLFEKYGVPMVFAGHDHNYERTKPINGVTYVVTGGGGRGTRAVGRSSYTAYSEDVLHFIYAEVEADRLLLHAIDGVGREFDSVRLERPVATLVE